MDSSGRSSVQLKLVAIALLCAGAVVPTASGQKQLILQLQRDLALMHDELRQTREVTASQLAALEARLQESAEKQDRLLAVQGDLERRLRSLDSALTDPVRSTSAQVSSLTEQFSALRAAVEEIGSTVDRIHDDARDIKTHLTTAPISMDGEEGAETDISAVNASEAIFEGGLTDYLRGEIKDARGQFLDYLALYPTHPRAAEAQFYLAETYYADADYEEAIRQYEQVYERHPLSSLAPDSLYKQGMAYEQLRDRDAAIKLYEQLMRRFPESNVSGLARSQLNSLESSKPSPGR